MTRAKNNLLLSVAFGIIAVILIILWITMIGGTDPARAWRGLLINYLFYASASAGLVVWPAVVIVSEGECMKPLENITRTGMIFAVPSILSLLALWMGSEKWVPWLNVEHNKIWLNNNFLFLRNFLFLIIFWIMVYVFYRNINGKNRITLGAWLIFVYAVTFSLAGFDFIMSLNPEWHSMMMGGYYFINGMYAAAVAWAFLSIMRGKPDKDSLLDVGRLIVTFSLLTTYLMFSTLLPIWYENLPDETNFLIPMFNFGWRKFSYLIIFLVYLGPLVLLMSKRSKRSYIWLGFISFLLLLGLWLEKWWIVSSVFERNQILFGWSEVIPALIFLSLIIAGLPLIKDNHPKVAVNE
jgi:hypothetical protein